MSVLKVSKGNLFALFLSSLKLNIKQNMIPNLVLLHLKPNGLSVRSVLANLSFPRELINGIIIDAPVPLSDK